MQLKYKINELTLDSFGMRAHRLMVFKEES